MGSAVGGFSLFCSASPRHLMPISIAVGFFFFGSDLMGEFSCGWLFSLSFSLATPPNADLCVFCCCFCISMVVVLVSCYGGSSVRQWWGGMSGVDRWVGRQWMG